jgi:hypothetical protein
MPSVLKHNPPTEKAYVARRGGSPSPSSGANKPCRALVVYHLDCGAKHRRGFESDRWPLRPHRPALCTRRGSTDQSATTSRSIPSRSLPGPATGRVRCSGRRPGNSASELEHGGWRFARRPFYRLTRFTIGAPGRASTQPAPTNAPVLARWLDGRHCPGLRARGGRLVHASAARSAAHRHAIRSGLR